MSLTPRQKLVGVSLSLGGAIAMASAQGAWNPASVARLLLGTAALGGLVAWLWRARDRASSTVLRVPPRLKVIQRVGLSQRSALALVEIDGRAFIVVHGDGFARIRQAPLRVMPSPLARQVPAP